MGIGLPMATYVIAQGGSVDPRAGVNARNLEMVDALVSRLEGEGILKSDVFYGHERVEKEYFVKTVFENDLFEFSKLENLMRTYQYLSIIMATRGNYEILSKSAHLPHVFKMLGSYDYPIIIAKEWIEIINAKGFNVNKRSLLINNAINMKHKAMKSIEQIDYRSRHNR